MQEEDSERRALLERGRSILIARTYALKGASRPATCTLQVAWTTLRQAMAERSYYLSVDELRLLVAVLGTPVDIYESTPSIEASNSLTPLERPAYLRHMQNTQYVKVVLDLRDDPERKLSLIHI